MEERGLEGVMPQASSCLNKECLRPKLSSLLQNAGHRPGGGGSPSQKGKSGKKVNKSMPEECRVLPPYASGQLPAPEVGMAHRRCLPFWV
jgi:hypothetical protein